MKQYPDQISNTSIKLTSLTLTYKKERAVKDMNSDLKAY